ncbi:chemotaxis protein CheR [Sporocytophaga myxococcoides]|uniref:Chemotaxis protein CheR n=1 Tax=Sporocytophaga myxococcoides TaxID=153721 RepID=A0A098LIG6_9BACT|nr:CheR family methyltransferase [Sporocytophaga myxococcoides]GAL86766.1 chemotaxis protein CheR [Sporocytophaga myxococcoides]
MQTAPEIGINELRKLIQTITERFDYDFSNYSSASFKRRIQRFIEIKRLGSVENLVNKIISGEIKKNDLFTEVSVNVTELFRDPSFWKYLRKVLQEQNLSQNLKIWQVGCSSGEEVFSLMILLNDLNLLNKAEVISTDFNTGIIDKAQSGLIPGKSMELNTSNFIKTGFKGELANYFMPEGDNFKLNKDLLSKIKFKEINLVKDMYNGSVDMILCRNILIYHNPQLQNDILKKFHQSLNMSGLLILGSRETVEWSEVASKYTMLGPEERIFRKNKV